MFTLRSALYHMKVVYIDELDSLDEGMNQDEESKKINKGDSSTDTSCMTGNVLRSNDDLLVKVESGEDMTRKQSIDSKKINHKSFFRSFRGKRSQSNELSSSRENGDTFSKCDNVDPRFKDY